MTARITNMDDFHSMSRRRKENLVSVIVPVGTRVDDLAVLHEEYHAGLKAAGVKAEFIYILDGPHQKVEDELDAVQGRYPEVTVLHLAKKFGEATALSIGFEHSSGDVIVTLPAYFQVRPQAISAVIEALDSHDMALAVRWPRRGGPLERARRNAFHRLLRWVTGTQFRDLGCGARAFRREVAREIELYGDQHRFLPVLAVKRGFRVAEVEVPQSDRDAFHGRYRIKEYLHRLLDISTVFFLVRFTKKPLRFFGTMGSIIFLTGGVILAWLVIQRLFFGIGLADRPALLLSSLFVVLGIQVFALGLIGELIIFTHARDIKEYTIERVVSSAAEDPGAGPDEEVSGSRGG